MCVCVSCRVVSCGGFYLFASVLEVAEERGLELVELGQLLGRLLGEVVVLLIFLAVLLVMSLLNLSWTIYYFEDDGVSLEYRQLLWVDIALTSASLAVSLAALTRYVRLLGPFCCPHELPARDQDLELLSPARGGGPELDPPRPPVATTQEEEALAAVG